jgi:hypothetical protein
MISHMGLGYFTIIISIIITANTRIMTVIINIIHIFFTVVFGIICRP